MIWKTMFKGIGHIGAAVIAAAVVEGQRKQASNDDRISELLRFNNEFEERARVAERKLMKVRMILAKDAQVQENHHRILALDDNRGISSGMNAAPLQSALAQLILAREALK